MTSESSDWLQTNDWVYPAAFSLPGRPDHPMWAKVYRAIESGPTEESMPDFRLWCEESFWFACKFCFTFGEHVCREPDNPHYGKPWIDHPWVFDRCMELQKDPDGQWFRWPRGYFKTALITQCFTVWEWLRDVRGDPELIGTSLRTLILTYKAEQTGAAMMFNIKREIQNQKLIRHWPNLFFENPKESGDFSRNSLRIRQRGNPREPTVSISGLDTMPVSYHCDRIIMDDPVVRETVRSAEQIRNTYEAMKQATFLRADNTKVRYVGTHWAVGDPWALGLQEERFRLNHQDCYDEQMNPILRSARYLAEFKKDAGPYEFSCQMRGNPISDDERRFDLDWMRYYDTEPEQERLNKNVYLFVDTARAQKRNSDYTVVWVIALGADGFLYCLDVYRERLSLPQYDDLLFDLVAQWKPLIVFQEVFGAARDIEHVKDKQNQRGFRFLIEPVPDEKVEKEMRIESLMTPMSQGRYWFPRAGFGHTPRGEHRDILRVFRDDEYAKWTPSGQITHDDMLDCLAFTARPKVILKMRFPVRISTSTYVRKPGRDDSFIDLDGDGWTDPVGGGGNPTAWSN